MALLVENYIVHFAQIKANGVVIDATWQHFRRLFREFVTLKFQLRKPKDLNTKFFKGANASPGWEVRNGAILMTETRKTIHLPHARDSGTWEVLL